MRVLITGATGMIGRALVQALTERKDRVVVVTRNRDRAEKLLGEAVEYQEADPVYEGPWMDEVGRCDAVVHLAGQFLFAHRWTAAEKTQLRNSRILSALNLVEAIHQSKEPPKVFVSTSAIGYYGEDVPSDRQEDSPRGEGFLAQLCADWETVAQKASKSGVRVPIVRVGVVLSKDGGIIEKLAPQFRWGLGGKIGNGKQWISWIHREDLVKVYLQCLDDETLSGPINAVAPHPVTNAEFCRLLAQTLHRPCWVPIPSLALKAALGERATALLGGQQVSPEKLKEHEFSFQYPECESALQDLLA
ncbi:Nucleoside-diphosphate sugar epimerase [Planctomycetales bacterium 10988]|nr:Nucleoside-diphosphate sugar epimerase [Planctomycetales bacterium 10988]